LQQNICDTKVPKNYSFKKIFLKRYSYAKRKAPKKNQDPDAFSGILVFVLKAQEQLKERSFFFNESLGRTLYS
jgi:hypothetical protein